MRMHENAYLMMIMNVDNDYTIMKNETIYVFDR